MSDQQHPSHLVVRVGMHGLGVFTTKAIKKGETVFTMQGDIIDAPTRTSVQIGTNRHIEDKLAGFLNHNCDCSAKIVREKQAVVATRDLNEGDEVTFNYNSNEDCMASPFECFCCSAQISGKFAETIEEENV